MKEQEITLKSYRKEIEIVSLTLKVPTYELTDERRNWFPKYEDVLLRLFNNKREEKDILEIRNYYDSDKITMVVNLTDYIRGSYCNSKEECIEHLKEWFSSGLDIKDEDIKVEVAKAYIYTIPEYENNIQSFEGDTYIRNYIEWEE